MNQSNFENQETINQSEATIIKTDVDSKDGQNKCPKCGSTDISLNINNGKLRCNFCRFEFENEKVDGFIKDLKSLQGKVIGSGAQNIASDSNDILTFKCSSCGSEVVIDTSQSTQARCHWCRNTLSVNEQIPNGAIPDMVLPFKLTKLEAQNEIEKFVGKRKFYANPKFKQEFTTDNIMGVYFPYMMVDINAHSKLVGEGEHTTRTYTKKEGDRLVTYHDADLYNIEREFDLTISNLTIESNSNRLDNSSDKTNNVINSIMPFDTENCVKFNANYLKGYTSEKRDINVDQLEKLVNAQAKDIARYAANDTIKQYDRGVSWSTEDFKIIGAQWQATYLPVWLYSYQEAKTKTLHYVAVNARTKETMGSVPIHMPKLLIVSSFIELLGIILLLFIDWEYNFLFLTIGIIYFIVIYLRYRNTNARHKYETETTRNISNLVKEDKFKTHKSGLTNSKIKGANNMNLNGQNIGNKLLNSIVEDNDIASIINSINKKE